MSSLSWMFIFSLYLDLAEVLLFHLSCCVILAVLVLHSLSLLVCIVLSVNIPGDFFLAVFSFFFPSVAILQSRAFVVGIICAVCVFPLCMMKSWLLFLSFHD